MKKFVIGLIVLTFLLSCVFVTAASPATETLPNGAALEVTISDPTTCTEFKVDGSGTRDMVVSGTAGVGLGEPDATLVYVMDLSGSTEGGSGTGCSPIYNCEQKFIKALNGAAVSSGSVDEVGLVVFATHAASADMSPDTGDQPIIPPSGDGYVATVVDSTIAHDGDDGRVVKYTEKLVGYQTYCTEALQRALAVMGSSTNGVNIAVMVSDGTCDDTGGGGMTAFNNAIAALHDAGVTVHTIAAGTGSSCGGHEPGFEGTLQMIADGTHGQCVSIVDPGQLPSIIPDLVSTTLDSLEIEVDGHGKVTIPNSEIDPDLPHAGAVSVDYATTVPDLAPGDHTIAVTATGHDAVGSDSVTESVTIHVFDLALTPTAASNELGTPGQFHTVTATIGGVWQLAGRTVSFEVYAGPNIGKTGSCNTDSSGSCSFTYTALQGPGGLGTDKIRASVMLNDPKGETMTAEATKEWKDTTAPVGACPAGPNPAGKVPPAKGGQRPDGFYALTATDAVDPSPQIFVVDTGSGTIFGAFASGTNIKYTQAPGATPEQKPMSGEVSWHITGKGDAAVYAVDASGNQADPVSCLVPPPPK